MSNEVGTFQNEKGCIISCTALRNFDARTSKNAHFQPLLTLDTRALSREIRLTQKIPPNENETESCYLATTSA